MLMPWSLQAALYGEESGVTISYEQNPHEIKIAEAVGSGWFCSGNVGTLYLIKYEGKPYLVGAAHGFYKESGAQMCWDKSGVFRPDEQYEHVQGIDFEKEYTFKFPPVNSATVLKRKIRGLKPWSGLKVNDFVILELENGSILENQFREERPYFTLKRFSREEIFAVSGSEDIFFISRRSNYHGAKQTSMERRCQFKSADQVGEERVPMLRHNCDSGSGSSGAPLILEDEGTLYSLGTHYAGIKSDYESFESDPKTGNYFIPAGYILDTLEKVLGND